MSQILFIVISCSDNSVKNDPDNFNSEDSILTEKDERKNLISNLIPSGMEILDEAEGFLNDDDLLDKVLVLRMKEENDDDYSELDRNLMIIIGDEDYGWLLFADNPNIVLCKGCGGVFGDPYAGINIKDKGFTVEHYGGSADRWSRSISFKYNAGRNDWLIKEDLGTGYSAVDPNSDTTYTYYNEEEYGIVGFELYSTDDW